MVLPLGRLELIEVWGCSDVRLEVGKEEPLDYFGDVF
jgi:hypothetical protein